MTSGPHVDGRVSVNHSEYDGCPPSVLSDSGRHPYPQLVAVRPEHTDDKQQ